MQKLCIFFSIKVTQVTHWIDDLALTLRILITPFMWS